MTVCAGPGIHTQQPAWNPVAKEVTVSWKSKPRLGRSAHRGLHTPGCARPRRRQLILSAVCMPVYKWGRPCLLRRGSCSGKETNQPFLGMGILWWGFRNALPRLPVSVTQNLWHPAHWQRVLQTVFIAWGEEVRAWASDGRLFPLSLLYTDVHVTISR